MTLLTVRAGRGVEKEDRWMVKRKKDKDESSKAGSESKVLLFHESYCLLYAVTGGYHLGVMTMARQ
jgi:hypothetical protein